MNDTFPVSQFYQLQLEATHMARSLQLVLPLLFHVPAYRMEHATATFVYSGHSEN